MAVIRDSEVEIRIKKTKVIVIGNEYGIVNIRINQKKIKQVDKLNYLECIINSKENEKNDTNRKTGKTNNLINALNSQLFGKKQ